MWKKNTYGFEWNSVAFLVPQILGVKVLLRPDVAEMWPILLWLLDCWELCFCCTPVPLPRLPAEVIVREAWAQVKAPIAAAVAGGGKDGVLVLALLLLPASPYTVTCCNQARRFSFRTNCNKRILRSEGVGASWSRIRMFLERTLV